MPVPLVSAPASTVTPAARLSILSVFLFPAEPLYIEEKNARNFGENFVHVV